MPLLLVSISPQSTDPLKYRNLIHQVTPSIITQETALLIQKDPQDSFGFVWSVRASTFTSFVIHNYWYYKLTGPSFIVLINQELSYSILFKFTYKI